jgi:hypothetical protein
LISEYRKTLITKLALHQEARRWFTNIQLAHMRRRDNDPTWIELKQMMKVCFMGPLSLAFGSKDTQNWLEPIPSIDPIKEYLDPKSCDRSKSSFLNLFKLILDPHSPISKNLIMKLNRAYLT